MKILLVHNYYQQPGGEDAVFAAEADLLREFGHHVVEYTVHNEDVAHLSHLRLARALLWNDRTYKDLQSLIQRERTQLAHFHNVFPLLSPSVYYAAKAERLPVVQTLHNYRLLCPNGIFFRDGHVCEACVGRHIPWPAVAHACYRQSRVASAGVVTMLGLHRMLRTWATTVNVFIALTQFARNKFIEGGLAADKIMLKPNFVKTNGDYSRPRDDYALFVGRLSTDKGIETMLQAWRSLAGTVALKIVGDGPLLPFLAEFTKHVQGITYMGRQSSHQVHELMERAACVVVPSEWYETFGRVIVEAFANGTPVIASRIGALAELVEHEQTGLHFEPGNHHDLIAKVTWAFAHRDKLAAMGRSARRKYEKGYTPRTNYQLLMNIYSMAMKN